MKYNDKQFDTWYIYTILDIDSECRGFQFYKRLTDFRRTLCQAQNVWAVQLSSRGAQVRWGGPNGTLGCHPYPYLNWYLYYITLHDLYLSAYDSCLYMFLYVLYVFNCLQLSSYVLAKSTKDIFESEVCGWTCWSMWWHSQNPSSGSKSGDKVLKDKDTQSTCEPFSLSLVFGSIRRVITGWVRACGCTRGRVWKHRGRKVSRKCRGSLKNTIILP
jgi:hypothetical protein